MSEEKQIEEMARFMLEKSNSANVEPVFTTNEGQEIVLGQDLTKLLNDVLEQAFIPFLAEALYNADYRKQIKSEWVMIPVDGVARYRCGNINCCRLIPFGAQPYEMAYCPYCGAMMGGGAE